MNMKTKTLINLFSFSALLLTATCAQAQTPSTEFDAAKYVPSYSLPVPSGWGVERFGIPIEFAPTIPYKGVEDIRFAPGWGDAKSNEYWTYAFLWYLDGKPANNAQVIEKNLTAYYSGLVGRNIEKRQIPKEKLVPVNVKIKMTKQAGGDLETYAGTIDMLDYMEQKPMTLNCVVHIRSCANQSKTFMFYEISPRPLSDSIWKDLQKIWAGFECSATKAK
jgi:hypothetical protein